jgi:hypothetical protein
LIALLKDEYDNDFAALERDFEAVGAASFDELSRSGRLKFRVGSGGRRVILQFTEALAQRYYQVVHDAIRRYDSNHLILGDRYARHCPDVVAKAAGPYVDVVSTNLDWPDATDGYLPSGYLRNLHRVTGKPVLLTEYYVAARENRSGNKNSGNIFLTVETQKDRTAAVETRLKRLAGQPYVVGAHWFRFADEPTHGRLKDGEDYNFGLVDIDNRPYEGLTSALTKLHAEVPRLHRESAKVLTKQDGPIHVPYQPAGASDLLTRLTQANELAFEDDTLQVYGVLCTWTDDKIYLVTLVNYLAQRETYSTVANEPAQDLELTVSSPAFESPLTVQFPQLDEKLLGSGVQCRLSSNGLHYTLIVALPARLFGKQEFARNDRLRLEIAVNDLLNQRTTASDVQLSLAGAAETGRDAPGLISAGE